MTSALGPAFAELPQTLSWHVVLSASALGLGLIVSAPLVVLAAQSPKWRWPVLAFAGTIQTIPSLALLALFFPLLLALSALSQKVLGHRFPALGFLPSLLALTLYSMLPILRNGVAGVLGVDPAAREAALGVGMTERQRLLLVEAPLAAPVAMAGVRTAAVWVIGAATLATPVGQTSLGDYIFSGLQTETWSLVLFGCAASAGLAFVVDQVLGLVERGLARRSRRLVAVGLFLLASGVASAGAVLALGAVRTSPDYVVGAKNFSEQYILADLIQDRIERGGARAVVRGDLGSAVAFRALAGDEIDVYVDYSGTLWSTVLKRSDLPAKGDLLRLLSAELARRYRVRVLGPLGFENAYALAMPEALAEKLGVRSLEDLVRVAPRLTFGADLEFLSRIEWRRLQRVYGLKFKDLRRFQPTFLYRAAAEGEADVISAFSSDGRIAADHLRILADPRGAIPPYDAVVLLSPRRARDPRLRAAASPLLGRINLARMQAANLAVDRDRDKVSPSAEAEILLGQLGLKGR